MLQMLLRGVESCVEIVLRSQANTQDEVKSNQRKVRFLSREGADDNRDLTSSCHVSLPHSHN